MKKKGESKEKRGISKLGEGKLWWWHDLQSVKVWLMIDESFWYWHGNFDKLGEDTRCGDVWAFLLFLLAHGDGSHIRVHIQRAWIREDVKHPLTNFHGCQIRVWASIQRNFRTRLKIVAKNTALVFLRSLEIKLHI